MDPSGRCALLWVYVRGSFSFDPGRRMRGFLASSGRACLGFERDLLPAIHAPGFCDYRPVTANHAAGWFRRYQLAISPFGFADGEIAYWSLRTARWSVRVIFHLLSITISISPAACRKCPYGAKSILGRSPQNLSPEKVGTVDYTSNVA